MYMTGIRQDRVHSTEFIGLDGWYLFGEVSDFHGISFRLPIIMILFVVHGRNVVRD